MLVYDAFEWRKGVGKTVVPSTNVHQVEILVSCSKEVQVFGMCKGEAIPLKVGKEFRFKAKALGFESFVLSGTGQTEYGFRVKELARQDGEPLNADNPPAPPLPRSDNLVQKLHSIMRENARRQRLPVLEPDSDFFSMRYAIEEDDGEFEEEIIERLKAEKAASQEQLQVAPEAQTKTAPQPPEALAAE